MRFAWVKYRLIPTCVRKEGNTVNKSSSNRSNTILKLKFYLNVRKQGNMIYLKKSICLGYPYKI